MEDRVSIINLKVKQIQESLKFYQALGFYIPYYNDYKKPIYIKGGDFDLCIQNINHDSVIEKEEYELIQVTYKNVLEVDIAFNKTVQLGFKSVTKPWNTFWGIRSAKVIDPDGNNILLYSNL